MEQAYFHFIFNHFPILGTLFGIIILAFGLLKKEKSLEEAGLLTFTLSGILAIPAYLTGEAAEEIVEEIEGVTHDLIHEHEELAEKAIWIILLLSAISLITFIYSRIQKKRLKGAKLIVLVFALITFGLMVFVGKTGGEIRHSEIRSVSSESEK